MAFDVIVPEVGEVGMEVVFVRWLKAEGDDVAVGDALFEVDTEKSVMEVESYAAGTLTGLAVGEGDIIQTRQVIAKILAPGEGAEPTVTPTHQVTPPPSGSPGTVESSSAVAATGSGTAAAERGPRRGGVSPRARRVAKKLGIDTAGLAGSGADGLITEADVLAAAESVDVAEPPAQADAAERARRAIADLTTRSWQTIPHFYLELEAEVGHGLEVAKPMPLICASVAQALSRHPECNLIWDGDKPVPRTRVDLGLLVDAPTGLLIAIIPEAQDLDLAGMADAVRDAAHRARSGKLSTTDLGARSITISNLGMYAVDRFAAVIPTPDVLTLAMGRARTVPGWDGTSFTPRKVVDLTLSVDHRALDGAATARFMSTLESVLADPIAEGLA